MKRNRIIILIIFLVIVSLGGIILFAFAKNDSKKTLTSQPAENNDNQLPNKHENDQKKKLFEKLKAILDSPKYIEGPLSLNDYIQNSGHSKSSFLIVFNFNSEKHENFISSTSHAKPYKLKKIRYSQLGEKYWHILTKLIKERNKIRKQNERRKKEIFNQKIKDLGLFYRLGTTDGKGNPAFSFYEDTHRVTVNVDKNHSALSPNNLKDGIYQITGLESIPTEKKPWHCSCNECLTKNPFSYDKYVKADDPIIIKPYLKNHSL